jgi:uncharacterized protein
MDGAASWEAAMDNESPPPEEPIPTPTENVPVETPHPYDGPPATVPVKRLTDSEARTFAMLAHLSAFAGFVFPFGHVLGPLLVWNLKKDEHEFVAEHGREALNFQISMTIYYFVGFLLVFVLIGILVLIALAIFSVVVTIIAAVRANAGEPYSYPLSIKFIN